MSKATFSTRVSRDLLSKARDAVAQHQGEPLQLTLSKIAESVLQRQVASAVRKDGEIPPRPQGAQAGVQGRRKREQGSKKPPARSVFCTRVDAELREAWRDFAYTKRDEMELAELFEDGLRKELRALERKHGAIETRGPAQDVLRPGRRVR